MMPKIEFTNEAFGALGGPNLVYIRAILARDLFAVEEPPEGFEVEPDVMLYAVHAANGDRLAVLDDRATAFAAARTNSFNPVSVH